MLRGVSSMARAEDFETSDRGSIPRRPAILPIEMFGIVLMFGLTALCIGLELWFFACVVAWINGAFMAELWKLRK